MGKLVIIGAAGMVGREILNYSLLDKLHREIIAIDRKKEKMDAEIFDILDSFPSYSNTFETKIKNGDYEDTKDASVIVVSASIPMSKDIASRNDLLERNTFLMKEIAESIMPYNKDALFIIVSNPAEAMAHAFFKSCKGKISKNQVISSGTLLETSRLRRLLSEHYDISINSIFAPVYGEHGANILVPWSIVNAEGIKLSQLEEIKDIPSINQDGVYKHIRERAFSIIKERGFTDHAIARAVCRITSSALANKETLVPAIGVCVDDFNGLKDVFINLPAIITDSGVKHVFLPELTDCEMAKLKEIADNLYKNQQAVDAILAKS